MLNVELEEIKRENSQLKLKLGKTVNQLQDQYSEAQVLRLKYERNI
jgi:hypothetical protein